MIAFLLFCLGLLGGHGTADHLGRLCKCRIKRIDTNLCDDRADRFVDTAVQKLCADLVLQVITDITLAHGTAQ